MRSLLSVTLALLAASSPAEARFSFFGGSSEPPPFVTDAAVAVGPGPVKPGGPVVVRSHALCGLAGRAALYPTLSGRALLASTRSARDQLVDCGMSGGELEPRLAM